jgi:CBS domain containing-hemolysin-like protein
MILVALAVVFFLVLLNGVFSMSELAVVSARKARLQGFADRGDKGPSWPWPWPSTRRGSCRRSRSASP